MAVSLRFGDCNNGLNAGLWARTLNDVAANAWWNNAASLISTKTRYTQMLPISQYTAGGCDTAISAP